MVSRAKGYVVSDLMTTDVIKVKPETPLTEVVRLMLDNEIGSVVVVNEKDVLLGIITERDLIVKVIGGGKSPQELKAKDIMTSPVIYTEPDVPIEEAVNLMKTKKIGHLPVVRNGRVVGIIATGDVISIAPEYLELLKIKRKL